MSTLGQTIDRIADYMSRSDLTTQITDEINRAIQFYAPLEFTFNQNIWGFSTVASQEKLTFASASISDMLMAQQVIITRSSNDIWPLEAGTIFDIRKFNQSGTNTTAYPRIYAFFANSIYFSPIPDASYSIDVYGLIQPSTLSSTTSTNIFLTNAAPLIESRVRSILYADILRDEQAAATAASREAELLSQLQQKLSTLQSTRQIKPWC